MDLLATSTFGLEAIVARELEALGYPSKTVQPGRMLFEADVDAIPKTNLWLRAADRVLVRLGAGGTDTLPRDALPFLTLVRQMCPCCVASACPKSQ